MERHFMNPAHGKHFGAEPKREAKEAGDVKESSGQHHTPNIHVQSHHDEAGNLSGHTVHILHHDGKHEKHEHEAGDSDGIAQHIHAHLGGKEGQDHGYSAGEEEENESGFGPGV